MRKVKQGVLAVLLAVVMVAVSFPAGSAPVAAEAATQDVVTLNTTELANWTVGKTGNFYAYVNGKRVSNAILDWSSNNPSVATCENGVLTGVGPGTAIITCTKENAVAANCRVTVKGSDIVTLNTTSLTNWTVGMTGSFYAYVNGKRVSNSCMTWSSNNTAVATCEGGVLTAVGPGTAIISCTRANATTATCTVTVKGNDIVTLNTTSLTNWSVGKTGNFYAYVNGKRVANNTMTWSSDNTAVAICEGGVLTGVGPGTAVITCTRPNATVASCTVTVKGKDVVTLNATELKNWPVGKSGNFYTYVNGKRVANNTMTWKSSDTAVATCENGVLTAKGPGTATITCTRANATVASCTVTVKGSAVVTCNHAYTVESRKEAGCKSDGFETKVCAHCGDEKTEVFPAIGHTESDWIVDRVATCIQVGFQYKECIICGERLKHEDIPVTDHEYEITIVEPTCTQYGYTKKKCKTCPTTATTDVVPAKGHIDGDWIFEDEAYCVNATSKYIECTVCGEELYRETVPAIGHDYKAIETVAPTCTGDGYTVEICGNCGDEIHTNEVIANGHTESGWIVDNDEFCTRGGTRYKECGVCKEVLVSEVVTTPSHDYETVETVNPTCTESGYTLKRCTVCEEEIHTDETEANGHTRVTERVEPQLGVDGYVKEHCESCGEVYSEEILDMLLTDGVDSVHWIELKGGEKTFVIGHYNEEEAEILDRLLNEYRAKLNEEYPEYPGWYDQMGSHETLKKTALIRAVETSYLWDHRRPNGASRVPGVNENIAWIPPTNTQLTDAYAIMEGWIASEGHESNLSIPNINSQEEGYVESGVFFKRVEVENQPGMYVYEKYYVQLYIFG